MQHVQALPTCSERIGGNHLNPRRSPFIRTPSPGVPIIHPRFPFSPSPRITNSSTSTSSSSSSSASSRNAFFSGRDGNNNDASSGDVDDDDDCHDDLSGAGGIDIEIEKTGSNSRRIRSRIDIDASLQTVWAILTSYESLADFIPGLAVSKLLEKRPNFARLLQIGQQKLAFGLNFNAQGIVDCYERELEYLPFGQRRDIEFQMIEGDFKLFQGKWSIEQYNAERFEDSDSLAGQKFHSTLSYVVDVEPKMWLPVQLVEARLCREIKLNLASVRAEAQKVNLENPNL